MHNCDIIIIGYGPGGMEVAGKAVAQGLDTVVIERDKPGGTCLNRGCIPTKALCYSAEHASGAPDAYADAWARKNAVVTELRDNLSALTSKVTFVTGEARFTDAHTVEVNGATYTAPKIVIATGSMPARLPIPGAELAIDSDRLLELQQLPASICIIGGGVIGMEFACILNAFGVNVTVLEFCKEILPNFDKDVSKRLKTALTRKGINIITSAKVTEILPGKQVVYESKGKTAAVSAEEVLIAVGRRPVIPEGAQEIGITIERNAIKVDDNYRTDVDGIYAIGDVNARLMLAHAASAQGSAVMGTPMNCDVIPAAAFTTPECAMAGLTEEMCKEQGLGYKSVKAMFRSNGKAVSMGEPDGIVKLLVSTDTRQILGAHICGPHAADLIGEPALAMSAKLPVDIIAKTIHAHPTLGEVIHAAASSV